MGKRPSSIRTIRLWIEVVKELEAGKYHLPGLGRCSKCGRQHQGPCESVLASAVNQLMTKSPLSEVEGVTAGSVLMLTLSRGPELVRAGILPMDPVSVILTRISIETEESKDS